MIARIATLFLLLFGTVSHAAEIKVLTSVKPIHSLVAGVMQGVGRPELLVRGGQSPHAFSLKPSDARKIAVADLIVWVGPELEGGIEKGLQVNGNGKRILQLSALTELKQAESGEHEHHSHHNADGSSDRDHGNDAHIWLSTDNAALIVEAVSRRLAEIDVVNAALYRNNAERMSADIKRLDRDLGAVLKPVREIPFVVFHDAYGLLVEKYRLNSRGVVAVNPDRMPGAKHIRQLRQRIQREKVRCVFSEPQFQPKLVKVLIDGTDAATDVLDPLGAELAPGPMAYFDLMSALGASLAGCLSKGVP